MNRNTSIGFGIFALILTALLVIPRFVDLNKWKPDIQELASRYLDRQVQVDGNVSLIILPYPGIILSSVKVANAPWSKIPQMIAVDEITVTVALLPLLTKTLEFSQVSLVNPSIRLEVNSSGKNNWDFMEAQMKDEHLEPQKSHEMQIGGWPVRSTIPRINIQKGDLIYDDGLKIYEISDFQASLKSNSVRGPYLIKSDMILNDTSVEFKLGIDALVKGIPTAMDATLLIGDQRIQVVGKYNKDSKDFSGKFASKLYPEEFLQGFSPVQSDMTITADIYGSKDKIQLSEIVFSDETFKAKGVAQVTLGKDKNYQAEFSGFPGNTSFVTRGSLDGTVSNLGLLEIKSEDMGALFNWLDTAHEVDVSLKKLDLKGQFGFDNGSVQLSQLDLNLDGKILNGSLDINSSSAKMDLRTPSLSSWLSLLDKKYESDKPSKAAIKGAVLFGADLGVDAKLTSGNSLLSVRGNVWLLERKFKLMVGVAFANLQEILSLFGVNALKMNLKDFKGDVLISAGSEDEPVVFQDITANFKGSDKKKVFISGLGSVDFSADKPYVQAHMNIGEVDINKIFMQSAPKKSLMGANDNWSKEKMDFSALKNFDGKIKITADQLVGEGYMLSKLILPLDVSEGVLSCKDINGAVNGGKLGGSFSINVVNKPIMKMNVSIQGASYGQSVKKTNLTMAVDTNGHSLSSLIKRLNGKINLNASDIQVDGFDAQYFERTVTSNKFVDILSLLKGKPQGQTVFDSLNIDGIIQKGVISFNHFDANGPNLDGKGMGTIDLFTQKMDMKVECNFKNIRNSPPFGLLIKGSIYNPQKSFETVRFSTYVAALTGKKTIGRLIPTPVKTTDQEKSLNEEAASLKNLP